MSWSNQGGPWRSGQGPWGQGPSGSPPPGDLEEILRRLQGFFRGVAPTGGGSTGRWAILGALVFVLLWFAWGFYTVQPNEVGINLVFGRYTGKTAAGLNYNWPSPVGSVIKAPVWVQQITYVGYRGENEESEDAVARAAAPEESLMLTGDTNIVDVKFRVIWQIDPAKPEDFVFNIRRPEDTVKAVAESVMREVVGLKTIDGILTTDRKVIEPDVQTRMQYVLDSYHAGVLIRQVQLQSVDAPAQVISAYRDVTAAQQDEQRLVNEADTYANRVVPEAEGSAARIVLEAKAYREQTVAEAKGQTSRFDQVYEQYKNAPGVTRERMYLETIERVLGSMQKTVLDVSGVSPPVPYLALDALQPKPVPAAGATK
jgi:modulator of FtsH protease HflK